jgi:hypothetical protein
MAEDVHQLIERLILDAHFGKALMSRLDSVRRETSSHEGPDYDYGQDDFWGRLVHDEEAILNKGRLRDVFEKHVISRSPQPCPLATADLDEVAFEQLGGITTEDILREQGPDDSTRPLSRFKHHVLYRLPAEPKLIATFDFGKWANSPDEQDHIEAGEPFYSEDDLWDSGSGFCINCRLEPGRLFCGEYVASLDLNATPTPAAAHAAKATFASLLPCVEKSLQLIAHRAYPEEMEEWVLGLQLPRYTLLTKGFGKRFIADCLDAYFTVPTKSKDSLPERMRNALHLLIAADSQPNQSISMSLCTAAVESLVCRKTEGITEELSRNVATLLHHDSTARPDVSKRIKELYTVRSKTLHGDDLPEKSESLNESRLLAAGVLGAIVEWRDYQKRMADNREREEFFKQLDHAERTGRRIPGGAPDGFSRCLPERS